MQLILFCSTAWGKNRHYTEVGWPISGLTCRNNISVQIVPDGSDEKNNSSPSPVVNF